MSNIKDFDYNLCAYCDERFPSPMHQELHYLNHKIAAKKAIEHGYQRDILQDVDTLKIQVIKLTDTLNEILSTLKQIKEIK
jgi:hypothetical protein